jgi:DNA (cytosine-5)-methyltransferase 1
VLAHHYPDVPNLGDMTQIVSYLKAGMLEAPDVLVGGTPCQAFSVAGLRNSLEDDRGQLTLTYIHILDAIDAVRRSAGQRPAIALWENVPGVLNTHDNAFGCFIAGLAGFDEALKSSNGKWAGSGVVRGPERTVAWRTLDAQHFGLAQRRRRVFVVASAGEVCPSSILFESEGVRRDTPPSREAGQTAPTIPARSTAGGGLGTDFDLDGGLVCQPQGVTIHGTDKTVSVMSYTDLAGSLRTKPPGSIENSSTTAVLCISTGQAGAEIGIGATLNCNHEAPIVCQYGDVAGSLTARHDPSPCADRGMTVVAFKPGQSAAARSIGAQEEIACTLESSGGGNNRQAVALGMQVRRLTPVECERLQGFPDDYTNIRESCPDGPRYKALGNSMAVPVMRWIGRRIDEAVRS